MIECGQTGSQGSVAQNALQSQARTTVMLVIPMMMMIVLIMMMTSVIMAIAMIIIHDETYCDD